MAKEFKKMKGDERRWEIESAAGTLRSYAHISTEPTLLAEARKLLDQQEKEIAAAKSFIAATNSKTPDFNNKES